MLTKNRKVFSEEQREELRPKTTIPNISSEIRRWIAEMARTFSADDNVSASEIYFPTKTGGVMSVPVTFNFNIKLHWNDVQNYVAQVNIPKDRRREGVNVMSSALLDSKQIENGVHFNLNMTLSLAKTITEIADYFFTESQDNEGSASSVGAIYDYTAKRNKYIEDVGYGEKGLYSLEETRLHYDTLPAYTGMAVAIHELTHYANCHAFYLSDAALIASMKREIATKIKNNSISVSQNREEVFEIIQKHRYGKGTTTFSLYGHNDFMRAFAEFEAESAAMAFNLAVTFIFMKIYHSILQEKGNVFQSFVSKLREKQVFDMIKDALSTSIHLDQKGIADALTTYRNNEKQSLKNALLSAVEEYLSNTKLEAWLNEAFIRFVGEDFDENNISYGSIRLFKIIFSNSSPYKELRASFAQLLLNMFAREFVFFWFLSLYDGLNKSISFFEGKIGEKLVEQLKSEVGMKDLQADKLDSKAEYTLALFIWFGSYFAFLRSAAAGIHASYVYIKNWLTARKGGNNIGSKLEYVLDSLENTLKYVKSFKTVQDFETKLESNLMSSFIDFMKDAIKTYGDPNMPTKEEIDSLWSQIKEKRKEASKTKDPNIKENLYKQIEAITQTLNTKIEIYNQKVTDIHKKYISLYRNMLEKNILLNVLIKASYKLLTGDISRETSILSLETIFKALGAKKDEIDLKKIVNKKKDLATYYRDEMRGEREDRMRGVLEEISNFSALPFKYLIDALVDHEALINNVVNAINFGVSDLTGSTKGKKDERSLARSALAALDIIGASRNTRVFDPQNPDDIGLDNKDEHLVESLKSLSSKFKGIQDQLEKIGGEQLKNNAFQTLVHLNYFMFGVASVFYSVYTEITEHAKLKDFEGLLAWPPNTLAAKSKINSTREGVNKHLSWAITFIESIKRVKNVLFGTVNKRGENMINDKYKMLKYVQYFNMSDLRTISRSVTYQIVAADLSKNDIFDFRTDLFSPLEQMSEEEQMKIKEAIAEMMLSMGMQFMQAYTYTRSEMKKKKPDIRNEEIVAAINNINDYFLSPPSVELPLKQFIAEAKNTIIEVATKAAQKIKERSDIDNNIKAKTEKRYEKIEQLFEKVRELTGFLEDLEQKLNQ